MLFGIEGGTFVTKEQEEKIRRKRAKAEAYERLIKTLQRCKKAETK